MGLADTSTLTSIAELAISLIGVSGIVAVFLTSKPISPLKSARFMIIVATGSLVAFLGFVPIWLSRYLTDEATVWQYSAIIALALSAIVNIVVGAVAHTTFKQVTASFSGDSPLGRIAASVLTLIVVALMLVNIFGWPIAPNRSVYEIMLFVGLVQMAIAFASLVFSDRQ